MKKEFQSLRIKILNEGLYNRNQLKIDYSPTYIEPPQETVEFIERKWNTAFKKNKILFNGLLFRLDNYSSTNGFLNLRLSKTTYKFFFGSRSEEFEKKFGKKFIANPLSVGTLIETSDKKLLFGRRLNTLDFDPGLFSVLAGTMDAKIDLTNNVPDPFKSLLRELYEEKSIAEKEVIESRCLGLVYNSKYKQTYLPFFTRINISSETLLEKPCNELEFRKFFLVNSTVKAVENFLVPQIQDFSQTCLANIILWEKKILKTNLISTSIL